MASIQERKTKNGIHYRVQIRLKGYPVQRATFQRKTDAKKWIQQTETAIREGRYFKTSESKRRTFADLANRYQKEVMPFKLRSKQESQLLWWKEQLGHYVLADISAPLIVEHRDKLAKEITKGKLRSPATIIRYLAILSHIFTVAVNDWGWLDESPMRKVSKPKQGRGRVRFLSDDERERLLKSCRQSTNSFLYLVVVLALSTGMRQGEIMQLTWKDVDLEKKRIILHQTKNGERRVVPIAGLAFNLLKQYALLGRLDNELLFPSEKVNKSVDLRFPWEKALKQAQIEDFHFHDLRHSTASYLAMNGASLAEIADVLGHKTLQMVKRYAHLSEAHKSNVVAEMNKKIFG
jgi:integrase